MKGNTMTAKHTPGPWEYAKTSSLDDRYDIFVSQTGWTVARTVNNAHIEARNANARLIAAAPELLEACKSALRLDYMQEHNALADQLSAAIAKAEVI